jgi:hypothetical protein
MTTSAGHYKANEAQGEIALEERKNLDAAREQNGASDRR